MLFPCLCVCLLLLIVACGLCYLQLFSVLSLVLNLHVCVRASGLKQHGRDESPAVIIECLTGIIIIERLSSYHRMSQCVTQCTPPGLQTPVRPPMKLCQSPY